MRVVKRFTAVLCALFGGTYREQNSFGHSLLDTWIHVKLPCYRVNKIAIVSSAK